MSSLRTVSATLLICSAFAAEPQVTSQASASIQLTGVSDAKQVSKAKLFVTTDGGTTWSLAQELTVAPEASALPTFAWTAPADGTFGFKTAAVRRDGRGEPDPGAGVKPDTILVVDRATPKLDLLTATLGQVADGKANLAISWKVSDPNLGKDPVSVEISTDQGKSFSAQAAGAAEGTTALAVPVAAQAHEVQVRLVARDLAGNVLTSPAKAVALPEKPVDPEVALAAAVGRLPKPEDLGVARSNAIITAGESPLVAEAAPAAGGTAVVEGKDVENAFANQSQKNVAQPGQRGRQLAPVVEDAAAPAAAHGTEPDANAPFLVGAEAERLMALAMKQEADGDTDAALAGYLRLHRSSSAKDAIAAELALLKRLGDQATIAGLVAALPPELKTDAAKLAGAKANLALKRPGEAAILAAKVRAKAPEAREALLVLGRALKAQGRAEEAKRVFAQLTAGNDEIAAQARAE